MIGLRGSYLATGGTRNESLRLFVGEQDGSAGQLGVGVMATWGAPDAVEREFASAELDDLALAHDGQPWTVWKESVLEWHLRTLAAARSEAWIPGLAERGDPVVEKALGRFYSHHMGVAIRRLRAENLELRRKMLETTACARFYASGVTDAGARANALLKALQLPSARMAPAGSGSSH
jgi:hypothetical protein